MSVLFLIFLYLTLKKLKEIEEEEIRNKGEFEKNMKIWKEALELLKKQKSRRKRRQILRLFTILTTFSGVVIYFAKPDIYYHMLQFILSLIEIDHPS